jgi:hypothetical protein
MKLRSIGQWRGDEDPDLSRLVDPEWCDNESDELSEYLEYGTLLGVPLSGPDQCKLCDFRISQTFILTDGIYMWRQLLYHYVGVHKVHLPEPIVSDMLSRLHELQDAEQDTTWWRDLCEPAMETVSN